MRSPFLALYFAMLILAGRGIVIWMGERGWASFKEFMFGPYVEFWGMHGHTLTPDLSNPVWWAIGGIAAIFLAQGMFRIARAVSIGVLAFWIADFAGWLAGMQSATPPGIDFTLWAMIGLGWLMMWRAVKEASLTL